MALFPLVGITLGVILAGANFLLTPYLPRGIIDLFLVAILAAVTGCLHLDGLADVCDALAARGDRERFLAVMKDSRVGAVGVVGLVLGLLLKYQAILNIPEQYKREALLIFPTAARCSQVVMTVGARRARSEGLGSFFIGGAGVRQLVSACVITCGCAWFLIGVRGLIVIATLWLFTWGLRLYFHRRLGGISGDIIGFTSELNEILCLLLLLV